MKITNKLNLNHALYKSAVDSVRPLSDRYSVTELLKPTTDIILTRRHYEEITTDISDLLPALFGTAFHKMMESNTTDGISELRLEYGRIVGVCDLYNPETQTLEDYKTTSVSKVMKQDFVEHLLQCNLYAWLIYMTRGEMVKHIKINYLLKDWSKVQLSSKPNYPSSMIYVYEYNMCDSDYDDAGAYIERKIKEIDSLSTTPDKDLPLCTEEERWHKPDVWKLYAKEDSPRAIKVLDHKPTDEEKGKYIVKYYPGDDTRCGYYCSVCQWCNKNNVKKS